MSHCHWRRWSIYAGALAIMAVLFSLLAAPATAAPRLRPPASLTAAAGHGEVTLSWSAVAARPRLKYLVFQRSGSGGQWRRIAKVPAPATTHRVTGLPNGKRLVFSVRTKAAGGKSKRSVQAAAVPGSQCGPTIPKAGGSNWECTFADNFDGNQLDRSKWLPQVDFSSGSTRYYACYIDDPAVVSQSGGTLKLSLAKMPRRVNCPAGRVDHQYAAGQISTYAQFSQKYGRFEARMKSPVFNRTQLHEAFWLFPDLTIERPGGEIDISETYSHVPEMSVPNLHYGARRAVYNGSNSRVATTAFCSAPRGAWNTYTLEWSENRTEIKVNGATCLVNTAGAAVFKKRFIVMLSALLGPDANNYVDLQGGKKTTEVDYIRVWR